MSELHSLVASLIFLTCHNFPNVYLFQADLLMTNALASTVTQKSLFIIINLTLANNKSSSQPSHHHHWFQAANQHLSQQIQSANQLSVEVVKAVVNSPVRVRAVLVVPRAQMIAHTVLAVTRAAPLVVVVVIQQE